MRGRQAALRWGVSKQKRTKIPQKAPPTDPLRPHGFFPQTGPLEGCRRPDARLPGNPALLSTPCWQARACNRAASPRSRHHSAGFTLLTRRCAPPPQALHETKWTTAEQRYQKEFGRDVEEMHETGSLEWLSKGSGSFGTVHRPVPSQPWRPVRMRIAGTGSLLPEVQLEVAHQKNLGHTLAVSPSHHGKDVRSAQKTQEVLKEMIKQQQDYRKHVERRVQKLETALATGDTALLSPSNASTAGSLLSHDTASSPYKSPTRIGSASSMSRRGELIISSGGLGSPAASAVPFSPIVARKL